MNKKPTTAAQKKAKAATDKVRVEANYVARQKERIRLSKISIETVPDAVFTEPGMTAKGKLSRKKPALFPKMVLGKAQFKVIASLLRSRDPAKSAAEMVLVKGLTIAQAAKKSQVGTKPVLPQTVNNAVTRFKAAHTRICEAYTPKD